MIINDRLEFAFIHLPKCAGSTVRHALDNFDESLARMTAGRECVLEKDLVYRLPDSTTGDFHHLTLPVVAKFFPEEMDRLRRFGAYAIVREPHERLVSSLAQRLKQIEGRTIQELGATELRAAFDRILAMLDKAFDDSSVLPPELVHFQPQWDYLALDGEMVAQHVYPIHCVDAMFRNIATHFRAHGEEPPEVPQQRVNTSQTHRFGAVRAVVNYGGGFSRKLKKALPASVKPMLKKALYTEKTGALSALAALPESRAMVARRYADDLRIWTEVTSGQSELRKTA